MALKQILVKLFFTFLFLVFCGCTPSSKPQALHDPSAFTYLEFDIQRIQAGYASGAISISGLTQAYLDRITALDKEGPRLNAIISINPDALEIAQLLDDEYVTKGPRGPLHGIPVVIKDNIDTHDKMPTTCGSRALTNSFPLSDSFIVEKLREAGAIILGKANLSEWANFRGEPSSSGWSAMGGQCKNPYVLDRNPCGSSSGSGVAVAANLSVLAIGTETNGSIMCPSNNNGIVGVKPTVGLVSRNGVIPISYTQDSPGPMARTVRDAAVALGVLAGADPRDAKTMVNGAEFHSDYTQFLDTEALKGKRIGFYTGPMGRQYKVDSLMYRAVARIKALGAEIVEVNAITQPGTGKYSFEVMLYEYKAGLNQYFKSLGPQAPIKNLSDLIVFNRNDSLELRFYNQTYLEMAQAKSDLSSSEYIEALRALAVGSKEKGIDRVLDSLSLDAFIAPTGAPAWKTDAINGDHYILGSSSPAAWAGYPSISVPMGEVDGLPVGISFFSTAWSEPKLLGMAYAYEQATQYRKSPEFRISD